MFKGTLTKWPVQKLTQVKNVVRNKNIVLRVNVACIHIWLHTGVMFIQILYPIKEF